MGALEDQPRRSRPRAGSRLQVGVEPLAAVVATIVRPGGDRDRPGERSRSTPREEVPEAQDVVAAEHLGVTDAVAAREGLGLAGRSLGVLLDHVGQPRLKGRARHRPPGDQPRETVLELALFARNTLETVCLREVPLFESIAPRPRRTTEQVLQRSRAPAQALAAGACISGDAGDAG